MGTIISGTTVATFLDRVFIFNPVLMRITAGSLLPLRVRVSDGTNSYQAERTPRQIGWSYTLDFDLSGMIQGLFDTGTFGTNVRGADSELAKSITIELFAQNATNPAQYDFLGSGQQFCIWGAMQIGQKYKIYERLTYFPGYPFTVHLLIENKPSGLTWYSRQDNEGYDQRGLLGNGKYNLEPSGGDLTAERRIVYRFDKPSEQWPGIFDRTFDHTFRGITDDTQFIILDVAKCTSEKSNGVYLRWIGMQGEWFYYLFDRANVTDNITDVAPQIEQYYTSVDISLAGDYRNWHPGTGGPVGKLDQPVFSLVAPLLKEHEVDYVRQILSSPRVDMLLSNPDATFLNATWVRVNVQPGSFSLNNEVLRDVTFNILLPNMQTQRL